MSRAKQTMLVAVGGEMLEVREGYARAVLPLSEMVMQPTRVFHAGAIAMLADETASAAIVGGEVDYGNLPDKPFPYSVQISMNLLSNDPVGPLTAEAKVVRKGRMTVVQTTVTTSSGTTAALMTSTHLMVDLRKTGPHSGQVVEKSK